MLLNLGFKNLLAEPRFVYTAKGGVLTEFILYVDDVLITSQVTSVRDAIARNISRKFEFISEGVASEFMGVHIKFCRSDEFRYILLTQQKMIMNKVEEFGLLEESPVNISKLISDW